MQQLPLIESSFAKELFSESLQLSNAELGSKPIAHGDLQDDGGSLWGDSVEKESLIWTGSGRVDVTNFTRLDIVMVSWQGKKLMHKRDLMLVFSNQCLVLTFLPDDLKEKLIETQEKRRKNQGLYESVHTISSVDALIFFRDYIMRKKAMDQRELVKKSSDVANKDESSCCSNLEIYVVQLQSLLDSPTIKLHLSVKQLVCNSTRLVGVKLPGCGYNCFKYANLTGPGNVKGDENHQMNMNIITIVVAALY
ncbi:hypothetical protein DKX38_005123 [Salix brachista]|uniref:Uncharacterized protein n=1 Tax=Salix brachista TaxID=2182728 RepID=A0A5N5NCQ7_9ROSI|nr:hypothetical protein DKX38_005123 [Salix brachista]